MITKNVLNSLNQTLGTLTLPSSTSEQEWNEQLNAYKNAITPPAAPNNDPTIQAILQEIENLKTGRFQYLQFQIIGKLNNSQYLYAGCDVTSGLLSSSRRSGNASNGYRYSNSAPVAACFTGKVVSASASITGVSTSTGSATQLVQLKYELWKVGFNSEGVKLGDILFDINSSTYTIGKWYNSSVLSTFSENQPQDVNVVAGDLLGLKFISQTGDNKIVETTNATIVLEVRGSVND